MFAYGLNTYTRALVYINEASLNLSERQVSLLPRVAETVREKKEVWEKYTILASDEWIYVSPV